MGVKRYYHKLDHIVHNVASFFRPILCRIYLYGLDRKTGVFSHIYNTIRYGILLIDCIRYGMVWKMTSKTDWLYEGCIILAEMGVQALTIELLCQRLKLTKGSFYHHFKGFNGYKTDLMAYFEREGTFNIIEQTEQAPTPSEKLVRLLEVSATYPPNLEIAIRSWALQDADVQRVQTDIDAQRMTYLQELFIEMGEPSSQALILARLLYTIFIGCQHIQPPIDEAGMTQLFHEFQRLYGGTS